MSTIFIVILGCLFIGKLIKAYYPELFMHIIIAAVITIVVTGGVKWKNRALEIDGNNRAVAYTEKAVIRTAGIGFEVMDSMKAAADDSISAVKRQNQLNIIAGVIKYVAVKIKSYGHATDVVPYLSDLYKVDKERQDSIISSNNRMVNSEMARLSETYHITIGKYSE